MTPSYPQLGTLLVDRYRLIRVIGEGGMGVVFEAQNVVTEKRVAIKWLHASVASSADAAKRLVREATAACRVRHPNVVDVYDVVRAGDAIFLVMEYLEGEPLEEVLKRGGMPLHQLVALLLPAMRGVAEAHRQKVIHRDVHPGNIFLARQPNEARPLPKVLDFGISKLGGEEHPPLTRAGTTMGTPLYMSYEQLCSASDVDGRTDVYSFGIILYEALTGKPPFEADTFAELAVKIATATPIPPKQLRPDIPSSLERLILWAMERERSRRIESLELLLRELEPFALEHAFRAQMTESDRTLPAVAARVGRGSTPAAADDARERGPRLPASTRVKPRPNVRAMVLRACVLCAFAAVLLATISWLVHTRKAPRTPAATSGVSVPALPGSSPVAAPSAAQTDRGARPIPRPDEPASPDGGADAKADSAPTPPPPAQPASPTPRVRRWAGPKKPKGPPESATTQPAAPDLGTAPATHLTPEPPRAGVARWEHFFVRRHSQ